MDLVKRPQDGHTVLDAVSPIEPQIVQHHQRNDHGQNFDNRPYDGNGVEAFKLER